MIQDVKIAGREVLWFCCFFSVFLISLSQVYSQTYNFQHFTTKEGLTSATLYYTYQDRGGHIWFCSNTGVNRFDGNTFAKFTKDDGLSDNEVFSVNEDIQGRTWFMTFNGRLSYMKNNQIYNEDRDSLLSQLYIAKSFSVSFQDSKDRLFFSTIGNSFVMLDQKEVHKFNISSQPEFSGFRFFEQGKGHVIIYGGGDFYELGRDLQLIHQEVKYHTIDPRFSFAIDSSIYYLSWEGIIKRNAHEEKIIYPASELPSWKSFNGLYPKGNDLVITTQSGVLVYPEFENPKRKNPIRLLDGISVSSFLFDREGNSWFCTQDDGVFMLPAHYEDYEIYDRTTGLPTEGIYRVECDSSGRIWIGQNNGYLSSLKNHSISSVRLDSNAEMKSRIMDLIARRNQIWMATDHGFQVYEAGKPILELQVAESEHETGAPSTKAISMDSKGNVSGVFFLGATTYDSIRKLFVPLYPVSKFRRTYTCAYDHADRLWIADITGLNCWNGTSMTAVSPAIIKPGTRILQIAEWRDSILVFSTDGNGVIFFDGAKIVNEFRSEDGLISNSCKRVTVTGDSVWICTNKGLQLIRFDGKAVQSLRVLNDQEGLPSNEVRDVLVLPGKIVIGTAKGLCVMKSLPVNATERPPLLHITGIFAHNKTFGPVDAIEIPYGNNQVRISFIGINFKHPQEVKYQYSFDLQQGWNETENSSIDFSNLSPGDYSFMLRTRTTYSDWSPVKTISFKIIPPFWMTLPFRIAVTLLITLLIMYVYRSVVQRKLQIQIAALRHRDMIQQERLRISEDMHDDLGSDLTKIGVLSEMIRVIEPMRPEPAEWLKKISFHAIDLRKKFDEIIWALDPDNDNVGELFSYLQSYSREFFDDSPVSCSFETEGSEEEKLSSAIRRNIFLTFKEILNNSLRHSGAKKVHIHFLNKNSWLIITVKDDGKGFDTGETGNEGHGLKNLRSRMERIGGELQVNSLPGGGSTTKLRIPVQS